MVEFIPLGTLAELQDFLMENEDIVGLEEEDGGFTINSEFVELVMEAADDKSAAAMALMDAWASYLMTYL